MKTFILTITILLLSSTTFSQELILLTEHAPPNSYIENDELTGFCVEVVQAVLNEIGMGDQKIEIYPWARAYKMLQEEKNVALFATSRTEIKRTSIQMGRPNSGQRS